MCGIAGIIRFDGAAADAQALRRACAAQRHRGPDHEGVWVDPRAPHAVGFSAVRLAVQDPRPQADQPFTDPTGRYVLSYNGELYNGDELRVELEALGWPFRTTGDTEIVLAACATWGRAALPKLDGMWALAFYDAQARRGFLARDAFGIKPLVYAASAKVLLFASELRGLLRLGAFDRRLDELAMLHHLLMGYIAHPRTIHAGACRLEPGASIDFSERDHQAPRPFTDLKASIHEARGRLQGLAYADAAAELRGRVARATVRQRVADVPLGCFLSGGVDSSIVATHLAEASSRPIQTFAIGHAEHASYDETSYARLVAARLRADHHEWRLTRREVLDALPDILDHLGEPLGDSSVIPATLVSRLARRHVTVALSGDGADELFGGYWRYTAHAAARSYQRLPRLLRTRLLPWLLRTARTDRTSPRADRARQWRKLLRAPGGDAIERHLAWARIMAPEAEVVLRDPSALQPVQSHLLDTARALSDGVAGADDVNAVMAFDVQYGLPGDMLQKVDLASMSCSLEVRVPFLDPAVAAMGLAAPVGWKLDRGLRKRLLIDAYRGILPDAVLDRPKKGFEVPFGEYIRGPLLPMFHDVVTRETVASLGLLSFDGIGRVLEDHVSRRGEHADLLFALLTLCWWRAGEASPSFDPSMIAA